MKKGIIILLAILLCGTVNVNAQRNKNIKQIRTTPDNARIYIDGNYVGDGTYSLQFQRNEDFISVKVELPGYVTKEFNLYKSDTRNTIGVKLVEDDALEGSTASDLANKYFTIRVRDGVDVDQAWKLLSQVMLDYFNEMKTSDKASGYMNTS